MTSEEKRKPRLQANAARRKRSRERRKLELRSMEGEVVQPPRKRVDSKASVVPARSAMRVRARVSRSRRWPQRTRLLIKGVEKELRKDNYGVFWWTVHHHQC